MKKQLTEDERLDLVVEGCRCLTQSGLCAAQSYLLKVAGIVLAEAGRLEEVKEAV